MFALSIRIRQLLQWFVVVVVILFGKLSAAKKSREREKKIQNIKLIALLILFVLFECINSSSKKKEMNQNQKSKHVLCHQRTFASGFFLANVPNTAAFVGTKNK